MKLLFCGMRRIGLFVIDSYSAFRRENPPKSSYTFLGFQDTLYMVSAACLIFLIPLTLLLLSLLMVVKALLPATNNRR